MYIQTIRDRGSHFLADLSRRWGEMNKEQLIRGSIYGTILAAGYTFAGLCGSMLGHQWATKVTLSTLMATSVTAYGAIKITEIAMERMNPYQQKIAQFGVIGATCLGFLRSKSG